VARAQAGEFEAVVAEATEATLHPDRQSDPVLREMNLRMARGVGLEGMVRQQEAIIARIDSRPSLGAINVPTLVLVGDSDPLTPPERAREIAEAIAGAELVVVPNCGHASTIEQPEAVNAALVRWIKA
jgi:pimeloyl-ACP methyl ester carboxylesterase